MNFKTCLSSSVNLKIDLGKSDISVLLNLSICGCRRALHLFWSSCVSFSHRSYSYPPKEVTLFLMGFVVVNEFSPPPPSRFAVACYVFLNLLTNHCTSFIDTHKVNVLSPWAQTREHCQTHRADIIG